jgi:hypothetical protein
MADGKANGLWGSLVGGAEGKSPEGESPKSGGGNTNLNKKPLDFRPGVFVLFFCFLEADTTKW